MNNPVDNSKIFYLAKASFKGTEQIYQLKLKSFYSLSLQPRAYTEINVGGGKICAKRKNFFCPPLGAPRGGQNSNCKFITLGFLDIRHKYKILKRHTYSPNNYLLSIVSKKSTFYYTFIGIFSI